MTISQTSTRECPYPRWQQSGYWYDSRAANRVIRFIEKHCVHVEDGVNTKAGDPVRLHWWQKRMLKRFFGWKRVRDNRRRYKTLWVEIPRKNGKTSLAAWVLLYLLFADGERGAQIGLAAADTDQANVIFDICKTIVQSSPKLNRLAKCYQRSIFYKNMRSTLRLFSGRPKGKHGKNLHGLVVDEVHEQPNRQLIDALRTSNIARRQPVEIYLTTAGDDPNTICYEFHEYAVKVRDGTVNDPTFMPVVFSVDISKNPDAWKDERNWYKANPNLGVTFDIEKMREDFELAAQVPAFENTFKRLRLNIWTEQEHRAIPMDKWRACVHLRPKDSLSKRDCYLGLDLAATTDIAAGVLVFPPFGDRLYYDTLSFFWYPELNITERKKRAKVDLTPWSNQGHIKFTEGNVIDQDVIRADIKALNKLYRIREIAIDRWNSVQLQTQLSGDGFNVVPFGQGYGSMTDPTKQLIGLVLGRRLNHDANPVLEWMASNFAVETNHAGDIKPSKKHAREKIDGIVALIMGLSRAIVAKPSVNPSIARGLIVLQN